MSSNEAYRGEYAELHVHSTYSFLDGVSEPETLVTRAAELGLSGVALTDHNSLAGVMQFVRAAQEHSIPAVIGTEFTIAHGDIARTGMPDPAGRHLLVLARGAEGYRRLSRALSRGLMAGGEKGRGSFALADLAREAGGHWQILTGCRKGYVRSALETGGGSENYERAKQELYGLVDLFGRSNVAVEISSTAAPLDRERNSTLARLANDERVRLVATNNVHYARRSDQPLADLTAAIRANSSVQEMRSWLPGWGGFMKSADQMYRLYPHAMHSVENAAAIAQECTWDMTLDEPKLPPFPVPTGYTEQTWLEQLVWARMETMYGSETMRPDAWAQVRHELEVIDELGFAGYFLIVNEIVEFCRSQEIWCQGRGSAANSAVCYVLGITAVDAVKHHMLFERFLSPERVGPPDIDLDIESRRRELVIQHVYERYGREYAAQVADVITYRSRSALRDAGSALGYSEEQIAQWKKDAAVPELVQTMSSQLLHLPRHLGLHSGGMVICNEPVINVCPVEWARMPGRTVLQWSKDDCASAGLVKFDLLGLGMLTALRKSFTALAERGIRAADGSEYALHNLPEDDPRVYDLLSRADTVGVFQVESRAQMSVLPRIRPREFYDIVVCVALIRPGPIQGGSVNPYIRRRLGKERVTYAHPLLENALAKTLGVPLFQEQLMRIAMDAAGFSPSEADRLRSAMGSRRSHERMAGLKDKLMTGMQERGIGLQVREEIFAKLDAFADFGFPESHAFSFAYLVYASAWLKVHYPEYFYAGILSSQPMGFYSPASLVQDARRHGLSVIGADVNLSAQESVVATQPEGEPSALALQYSEKVAAIDVDTERAIIMGLQSIRGLEKDAQSRIVAARGDGDPYTSLAELAQRARLTEAELVALAKAGALRSLGISRRDGIWNAQRAAVRAHRSATMQQLEIPGLDLGLAAPHLPAMTPREVVSADLSYTGVSPNVHVMEFYRPELAPEVIPIDQLGEIHQGSRVYVAGVVTHRQRPRTAGGITFVSLEDETGMVNVVCSPGLWQRYRRAALESRALLVRGKIEYADGAISVSADQLQDLGLAMEIKSRDFR